MWVAKISDNCGKFFDYDLSPKFDDIMDCQKYINEHLKDIEKLLQDAFKLILDQYDSVTGHFTISFGGSFIRCYNVEQHRFCTGFDF